MKPFWLLGIIIIIIANSCKNGYSEHNYPKQLGAEPDSSFIVLLDAGHGGKDGGAESKLKNTVGKKVLEKDIVFKIAKYVEEFCKEENIKIYLTRNTDTFLYLKTRLIISKNIRPNLLLSLHVNEYDKDSTIRGTEFYTVNTNNPYRSESLDFVKTLQSNFQQLNFMKVRGLKKSPTRLFLLHNSICPATLTELGYIFNKEDFTFLTNEEKQKQIAKAIAASIKTFKQNTFFAKMRLQKRMPFDKNYRTITVSKKMGDYAVVLVNHVEYNSELLTEIDTTKITSVHVRPPVSSDYVKYGFIAKDSIIELTVKNYDSSFIFKTEEEKQDFWLKKNKR